jgi:hypothetical protein
MSRKWLFENENLEGRGGVVLKASRRRFDLATTSFISGYGSVGIRCDDQVGERRVPQHVRYGESNQTPRSRWGVMYILFHAVMIGILGTTMYRFVDWFEPNRRLAQILKILVLVTGALALIAQLPA